MSASYGEDLPGPTIITCVDLDNAATVSPQPTRILRTASVCPWKEAVDFPFRNTMTPAHGFRRADLALVHLSFDGRVAHAKYLSGFTSLNRCPGFVALAARVQFADAIVKFRRG